ncbi:MAG TPA: DUF4019 domain-containing protein [Bryobacteraceae bacterium]|nr:DUF4019 domain-containing protein [Bryobacteraceae bacterium]
MRLLRGELLKPLTAAVIGSFATTLLVWAAGTSADAQRSAEAWLRLVDHQQYAESWAETGATFRSQISQEQWVEKAKSAREPLGALTSRDRPTIKLTKTLPGMPDGDYAVIQFHSSFKNKAEAVETVALVWEDSTWKVIGYFIR